LRRHYFAKCKLNKVRSNDITYVLRTMTSRLPRKSYISYYTLEVPVIFDANVTNKCEVAKIATNISAVWRSTKSFCCFAIKIFISSQIHSKKMEIEKYFNIFWRLYVTHTNYWYRYR